MTEYFCTRNSDLTEGKGSPYVFASYDNEFDAEQAVQGQGVMGVGTGEIYVSRPLTEALTEFGGRKSTPLSSLFRKVYGYRKNWLGEWDYGWLDLRDAPTNDPEFNEFLRLKDKFSR